VYAQTYNTGASQNTTNAAGRVIAGTDTTAGTYAETGSTGHKYDIVGSYIFANASGVVTNTRHNPFFIDSQPLSGVLSDSTKMLNHALNPTLFTAFGLRLESGNSIGTIQTGPSVPYAYAIDFVRFFAGDITNKWIAG
jgi:hypothetical protein